MGFHPLAEVGQIACTNLDKTAFGVRAGFRHSMVVTNGMAVRAVQDPVFWIRSAAGVADKTLGMFREPTLVQAVVAIEDMHSCHLFSPESEPIYHSAA